MFAFVDDVCASNEQQCKQSNRKKTNKNKRTRVFSSETLVPSHALNVCVCVFLSIRSQYDYWFCCLIFCCEINSTHQIHSPSNSVTSKKPSLVAERSRECVNIYVVEVCAFLVRLSVCTHFPRISHFAFSVLVRLCQLFVENNKHFYGNYIRVFA